MARFVIEVPDDQVAAAPKQGRFVIEQTKVAEPKFDPTEGMSTFEKVAAGAGKAMYDLARGAGQLIGVVDRKDIEESRKLDAALMATTEGKVGNFIGSVAPALGSVLIPGVNTMAGSAAIGAASGLLQPSTSTKETATNVAIGSAVGPAGVAAGRLIGAGYQGAKALVEPFYKAGSDKIAARTLQRFASDPQAAATLAAQAQKQTASGAQQTLAEATRDIGLAQLQRGLQSTDPTGFGKELAGRLQANNAARIETLRGIAKSPAEREAAVIAVEKEAQKLYAKAFEESLPVTPELARLAAKPSMQKAEARAMGLAEELGIPFQARLSDMRPQYIPMEGRLPQQSSALEEVITPGRPMPAGGMSPPTTSVNEILVRGDKALPGYFELPPVESVPVRDMHTMKMGMDALLADPTLGIAGREAAAVMATRNKLLDQMPESYQAARQGYIELNKPVNQMDIGRMLMQKYASATTDLAENPKLYAESLNRALQDEERLIKQATGLKGVNRLSDVMTAEQVAAVRAVADETGLQAAVASAGMAPGSPTAQNLASQNVIRQLLGPTGLPQSWAENTMLETLMRPVQFAAKAGEPKITNRLASAMLNPEEAAVLLRMANTPELAERFGRAALPYMVPAAIGTHRSLND